MAQDSQQNDVKLPESLQRQFASLEKRLWNVETAGAVSWAAVALLVSYLVLFFSDRLWDSPVWLRVLILGCGLAVAGLAIFKWLRVWVLRRRDWRQLAVIVQNRFRRLGDRLLGIVELAGQKEHPANFSPELYRAAIHQVAEEADKCDFRDAVETRHAKKLLLTMGALALVVLLPAIIMPAASWNVFLRWLAPIAAVPRYTLVRIEGLPEKLVVPHGESFEVNADVRYTSFWKPNRGKAQFEKQLTVDGAVKSQQVGFQIPGQVQKGILKLKVGDARAAVAVEPAYRPALKHLSATIDLPDYLQYPPSEEKIQGGTISLLEGSRISFHGKTTRSLKAVTLSSGSGTESLDVNGDEFSSGQIPTDGARFAFAWQDTMGLSNAVPWKLNVQTQRDKPPVPDLPDLSRDVAILQSDVLNIRTLGKDDFGVLEIGLSWDFDVTEEAADFATTEIRMQRKSPNEKKAEEAFRWSPAIYGVPIGTSVELVAFASDYFPGRERAESSVRRIHVLGNEQHAELVRQSLESVLARVEEVARAEEKIFAKTEELGEAVEKGSEKGKEGEGKEGDKENAEKLGKLSNEQSQNAQALEELAREGAKTLREALKNPVFTEQALQDWSKILQQMQQLADQQMKSAAANLKSAQKNSGDKSAQKQNLAEAKKQEQEALEQLEKIQGKVNKGLDDLQALTLSERLRKVATTESEVGGELKKTIPETIGLLPQELPDRFKRISTRLAGQQGDMQAEAQNLQREINRFFERTQKENYGEVSKEMTDMRAAEELDQLREMISQNVAMEATRNLADWSNRFNDWADKLQPPESNSSGSGSGEGNESSVNMTKTLVALLRLREKEVTVHSQTRLLDEQKETLKDYDARAKELSSTQQQLTETLRGIEKENTVPTLVQPYKEASKALEEVETLLQRPDTGKQTTDAEIKSIELLTDVINLINEQAQRNPPPPGSSGEESDSQDMAFLMQMMSPKPGPGQGMPMSQPGGNMAGGTTSRESQGLSGDARGKGGEERRVNKASGAAAISFPTEFRDTLESYYKALEQEQNNE